MYARLYATTRDFDTARQVFCNLSIVGLVSQSILGVQADRTLARRFNSTLTLSLPWKSFCGGVERAKFDHDVVKGIIMSEVCRRSCYFYEIRVKVKVARYRST